MVNDDQLNKTIDMRAGEELSSDVVDQFMRAHIDGLEGSAEIRQFPAGQSNLTYQLSYGERQFVLRRPPFGTKPKSGHSMIREYRVMNALKPVYPCVPETFFYQPDEDSPLGCEFYVMDKVQGIKLERDLPEGLDFSEAQVRQLGEVFFDRLIDLHNVDYKAIGLDDFGKPEGYVSRQILGWNGRFEKSKTDDVQDFQDVRTWLEENMPAGEVRHCIIHGDYRLDNVILNADNPLQIDAILDWEISALGDPLMDLGNTLAYWIEANDPPAIQALRMQPCAVPGMPTREEIVARYGEKTGIDVSGFGYYLVYGVFRLAVILQQIYYRYYHGQTKNPGFKHFGKQVDMLGNHARGLIEKI